jgi:putative heme iron utilization protein
LKDVGTALKSIEMHKQYAKQMNATMINSIEGMHQKTCDPIEKGRQKEED